MSGAGAAPAPDGAPAARVPVVGFDLDMTLVDSSTRIGTCLAAALAAQGVAVTPAQVWPTIGVPLEVALRQLAPGAGEAVRAAVAADYRARHDAPSAPPVPALPGAADALAAVRAAGGRTLVVSAKVDRAVALVLAEAGLAHLVDVVVGGRFAEAKGEVLVRLGATAYVGDHPGDVVAARTAGVEQVAVLTGPVPEAQLRAAGATTVLADLTALPGWLEGHTARLREGAVGDGR
ncbi:HAD family hydrolase [Quadrisphaera sp. DSM 44207]|uniref:HAD family hydrolase n=1 Tax=Quadrisphaera sp. DSM 44207 TaxID=1881057 RepID=UPI0008884F19|nr:HAD hydrolase-like protein [Quadrisphaera sp. DSM 44207]SDQ65247.1 phosphoglycolate phosphatase [Quadrisphaera sp. DSM 44207]